jgi:asparagine synthetase B (glutamine-hydrolysing)
MSDAEVVLEALVRDGESALDTLRGSFMLAFGDRRTRRTVIARDPIGFHPLYYAENSGTTLFASSALHLTASADVRTSVDPVVLADHLCHRWTSQPSETYLTAVRRLPPGSRAVFSEGRMQTERRWNPIPEGQPIRWLTEEETAVFPHLFEQAVDRCLSLGKSGIFLSGGLDSISIAVVAADRCRERGASSPRALSLAFPTPETDERREQTDVAHALSMPLCMMTFDDAVGQAGLLSQALSLNRHLSSPLLNRWEPAYAALARRGRDLGVETVLAGSGGDEWLTVTPMLAADLLRAGDVRQLASFLRAWQRSFRYPRLRLYRNALWRFGARPLISQHYRTLWPEGWKRRRLRKHLAVAPAWVAPDPTVRRAQLERLEAHVTAPPPADGFYLRELRESLSHPLVSLEHEERFEFGRLNGVRYGYPFWDADLVDMLMRTPPEHLNRAGRSKGLVRQAVARRVPGLQLDRQVKRTGTSFSRTLIAEEGRALAGHLGKPRALAELGVVDCDQASAFMRDALANGGEDLYRVWDLLNLESWVRSRVH